ncbi:MAG: sigma-70 family RNA polymerase sigma factor [Spirochaetota bacterium]
MSVEKIWATFHKRLLIYIVQKVASREDAEDILQSIFEKILKNQSQLVFIENLSAWLFKITKNEIISNYRKQQACVELSEDLLPEPIGDTPIVDECFVSCLQVFIQDLAQEEQYILRETLQGKPLNKTAADLQKKYSTVKSKYQRACEKLRKRFLSCCQIGTMAAIQEKAFVCPLCQGTLA